jgi:exonuclease SbcC
MAGLQPDPAAREENLRQFLVEHFPEPKGTVSSAAGAPHPLLLLRLQRELAGFALSNGDPHRCFKESYEFFKKIYAEHEREWDELNLTFVFCLARRDRELEAFRAQVETNAFFCRKFTVALDAPLETELARLPFFPLERREGGFQRPPSAQTLLKSCGVSAPLAASIVGRVSEETLVEGCLNGRFGEPKFIASELPHEPFAGGDIPQAVRLSRVEIENFRAYRRAQTFDLDANLVLLYGPNGFGKTSFFDAVDFAVTGDIGRLGLAREDSRFTKAARHLDAPLSESAYVTISFQAQDGAHKIHRTVLQRRRPHLDGGSTDSKTALLALSGSVESPRADHVDHLVRLFRATHLFSQEFQTLTEDFREYCRLSTEVVSRMLAFEDYVNAGRKVGKVLDFLRSRGDRWEQRTQELIEILKQRRAELARLEQSASRAQSPQGVAVLRESVRRMLASAGIEPSADRDPVAEARGWRALLEARISDTRALGSRLSELAEQAQVVTKQRTQLSAQQAEHGQTKHQFDEAYKQGHELRETVGKVESELTALVEQEQSLHQKVQGLAWQREAKPAYDALTLRQGTLTGEIGALAKTLADQSEPLEKLTAELNTAESQLAETTKSLEANRNRLAALTSLAERYPRWQQQVARNRELEQDAAQNRALIADLQHELQEATTARSDAEIDERRAAEEMSRIERTQSDLQNLLTALEAHVIDARCPACGTPHESKDELIRRLREQRNVGTVSGEATSRLQQARAHLAALQARAEELRARQQNAGQSVNASTAELQSTVTEMAGFEALVRQLSFDPTDVGLIARVREHQTAAERTANEFVQTLHSRQMAAQAARTALDTARAQVQAHERDLVAKKRAIEEVASQLKRIRSDAARLQVTLDTDVRMVTEGEVAGRREAEQMGAQISAKRTKLSDGRNSLAEHDRRVAALKRALAAQDATIRSLQLAIERYERDLEALGFARKAQQAQIAAKAEEELGHVRVLEGLKQNVTSLEMALDAAATSAAATQVTTHIRAAENELTTLNQQQSEDRLWIKYFEEIQARLQETQNSAVASYTDEYGPLTSVIQRRLRAVSGFEDISLQPESGGINVRVTRNGEHLPPTDFFSQSQQQVLILSLFLTACTTQTWSAFAPILLDDPVTHFDDLNVYSFLDLVGGLLESGLPGRQFILSTCDDRFFQLARQRFRYLGDRGRVYRFISCGLDGPVIERH